jgi:hypothetical protein
LETRSERSRAWSKYRRRERLALVRGEAIAALGKRRRCAGDHRQRRSQIVRDRGQQRAPDPFCFGLDLELRMRMRLRADPLHESRNDDRDDEHDREGQQVLRILNG